MFLLEFDRESMREPSEKQVAALATASEMDLRYAYFQARVSLAADGFKTETFPVPLLDFTHCTLLAARSVAGGESGQISFTESSMLIYFTPQGADVKVLRSWDPVSGSCGAEEFLEAASRFSTEVLDHIIDRYPEFRQNPYSEAIGRMVQGITAARGK
ncbi:hypothetical protein [Streptomyces peucetius]|uniref:Uncharacterized protein n=1 Tax=Streptomyces peucetius TaxID=1950 RepID=A0ABY6IAK5_STRPE|nr:hypothetical protein [Streptomyces peucetius]UYQ63983.1 hypothetical protein OGH68_22630 [Streptomyces peucetius]